METSQHVPIKSTATNFGLYYAILGIAVVIGLYILETEKNLVLSSINVIGTVGIIAYSVIAYKKINSSVLSLGQALKVGLATAAIGGVLIAIYAFIHYTYIQPEFIEAIREKALVDMYANSGDMPAEAEEQALSLINIFTSPGFISTVSIMGSLFFGLIISLITGLIAKSE